MMENRECGGEEKREYPSGPSYPGRGGWSGGYENRYAVSWQQRGYGQTYEHPHSQAEFYAYGSSYDRSSTSHGHTDFTTDATDNHSSFYRHTQSMYPAVDTSQVPHYYHHTQVPLDAARPYGIGHHHGAAAHLPPAAHTDLSAPPPQQQEDKSAQQNTNVDMSSTSDSSSLTDYAGSFLAHVQKFVARHREAFDLLVEGQRGSEDEIHHNAHSSEMYEFGEPDALEYHMNVEPHLRHSRFLELVSVGDVVRGHVIDKSPRELGIQVTSFVGTHKHRELSDIGVKGTVPFDNLADSVEKCSDVLGEMELNDVVQGIVAYQKNNGCLVLSFRGDHIEQLCDDGQLPSGVRVGYMEGRRPLSPRSSTPKPDDYLNQLEEDPGFLNPSSSDNLKLVLGIRSNSGTTPLALAPGTRPTLISDFQKEQFPESDYCHALRKVQRSKWSMDTVAVGVKHFKAGENSKAMKYFDHSLEIDESNVEGLVARGALFANDGKYKEGIADFEKALTLKHTHRNARNYLVQTQVAYGERLEKDGKLEEAVQCYREALADDPSQQTARRRLEVITAVLEKQAAEKRELERKQLEEKATLKKLQKLIEKEREKRNKKPKARKTKKKRAKESKVPKRKKKVSSRTKVKREHRRRRQTSSEEYSSDESTSTASSDYSRSRSRSPTLSKHKRQRSPRSISRSRSPRSESRSPRSRSKSVSRSPRSRTKRARSRSRTPRMQSKKPSTSKLSSRRSVSTSQFSDSSSTSPSRKYQSKHKQSRDRQL